jgi:copper chaperone CopZ
MHCAGCVNSIQRHLSNLQGVSKIEVNLANERTMLEYDPAQVKMGAIEKGIEEIGYRVVYEKVALVVEGVTDSSNERRLEQASRWARDVVSAVQIEENSVEDKAESRLRVHVQHRSDSGCGYWNVVSRACRSCDARELGVSDSKFACPQAVDTAKARLA